MRKSELLRTNKDPFVLISSVLGRRANGYAKGDVNNQIDLASFFQVAREAPRSAI